MSMRTFLIWVLFIDATTVGLASVPHLAPSLPSGWRELPADTVGDAHPVHLRLSLRQNGLDQLNDAVRRVSDPSSPDYGKFLTRAEVDTLTAPHASSIDIVEGWLVKAGVRSTRRGELIHATLTVAVAAKLLQTNFRHVVNRKTSQKVVLAGDFLLPVEVNEAVAAVYGLHGLPLPPHRPSPLLMDGALTPVNVTPALIIQTYGVSGVKPSGSEKNRQAVAEFQDQTMGPSDLETFFQKYVPDAPASASKIHKFVGDNGTVKMPTLFGPAWGGESSLDVDYIMGPAAGVLTEFWYFNETDFCGGLKRWCSALLASDQPPLVHSMSWGYQGNMSALACSDSLVADIDASFVKMAARGITVIISSGDAGSGYVEPQQCDPDKVVQDTVVLGTVKQNLSAMEDSECCDLAFGVPGVIAWSFSPPQGSCKQQQKGIAFEGEILREEPDDDEDSCCATAAELEGAAYTLLANKTCIVFKSVTGKKEDASVTSGVVDFGLCQAFSKVTGTSTLKGSTSGGEGAFPTPVRLYPSWPASSPMVTSVGATKFQDQDVTKMEVASESFGTGGGFSDFFPAFPAQKSAVAHYLQTVPQLPPKGSFPPAGRATPDVATLGEGYQVVVNGLVVPTAGTSASAPTFASLISLLNEARIQAGKPPMGYLNPWLYANPGMFNDVTSGSNALGRGTGPLKYGFNCTAGWDPVTGLGTPIFSKMLSAAMNVQGNVEIVV